MVQIIPEFRRPSLSDQFGEAFAGVGKAASEEIPQHFLNKRENKSLSDLIGKDISDIRDPHLRQKFVDMALQRENQAAKLKGEYDADSENYERVKNAFGEKFADIWLATGQGERTALTKAALDAKARGIDLDKILGESSLGQTDKSTKGVQSSQRGEIPEYQLNTEGMTPKESVDYKSALRKENSPIWKETVDQVADFKELGRDVKILDKINEKKNLPEGLGKLLIDPETGAPYPLGTIIKSPNRDVQQWAKTIARQATRAQTAFPGRVTNFDLLSYMRQFPGLFNTYDGRKVILKQMELSNKANLLMSEALDKVYSKHKLNGITPEDALDLARSMIGDQIEQIDKQLIDLAEEGEILSDPAESLSGKMIDVIGPDGKMYEVDESEVDQLPPGYRIQ